MSAPHAPIAHPSRAQVDCSSIAIVLLVYTVLCLLPLGFLSLVLVQGVITENELNAAGTQTAEKAMAGRVMIGVVAGLLVTSIVMMALQVFAALSLRRQQRWTLCMVMAVLMVLNIPLGSLIGIWMLITLNRPDVKAAFGRPVPASA